MKCECGCGRITIGNERFVRGHNQRGRKGFESDCPFFDKCKKLHMAGITCLMKNECGVRNLMIKSELKLKLKQEKSKKC